MEVRKLPEHGSTQLAGQHGTKLSEILPGRHVASDRRDHTQRMQDAAQHISKNETEEAPMLKASSAIPRPLEATSSDPARKEKSNEQKIGASTLRSLSRRGSVFVKKSRNSVDLLLRSSKPDTEHTSASQRRPETPNGQLSDALPTTPQSSRGHGNQAEGVSALDLKSSPANGRAEATVAQQTQKKDELKSAFRSLEGDGQKFLAKPVAIRTTVVRASLFPFLSKYSSDNSHENLRLEDIEKRCMVFKTWWAAILQTLKAGPTENLSEVDRSTLRDAIIGIMVRSEWTSSRSPDIRSNYAQMIYKQLSYVTDKMSQRKLPTNANLVSFCGKSCAYAFIYCPDTAEILISVWDIPTAVLKRILQAFGVESPWKSTQESITIARRFPRHLQSLAFSSLKNATNALRTKPQVPTELSQIQWQDPHWVTRWCGKESYLLCEFLQHLHVLIGNILPKGSTTRDLVCAPGVLFVYAQLSSILDYMIHPHSNLPPAELTEGFLLQNNDDVLKFDSAAPTMGVPPAISQRPMTDSHIIRLAREFLLDYTEKHLWACQLFAYGFSNAMKASARATSIYNHSSCFALCDFMQEAFKVLSAFERQNSPTERYVDWSFWVDVFKKMLQSENTVTEIRLYVLLFNMWPMLATMPSLKEKVCHDLLLDAHHFYARFNHWCPMVRGYYMRILCWRIARFDGEPSDRETRILEILLNRLQKTWTQHKGLWNRMKHENKVPLSTTPCNPAPGRRLLIIRTDIPSTPNSLSLSRVTTTASTDSDFLQPPSNGAFTPAQLVEKLSLSVNMNPAVEASQKKNGLLRSLMGSRTPDKGPRPKSPVRPSSSSSNSPQKEQQIRESTDISPRKPISIPPSSNPSGRPSLYEQRPGNSLSTSPPKAFRPATFKFSLELVDPRRALLQPIDLEPPRLPLAAYQLLASRPGFRADVPAAAGTMATSRELKYSGMALAEWTLVVNECQNFFERRRAEGVPSNRLVETPVLTVESLRRPL